MKTRAARFFVFTLACCLFTSAFSAEGGTQYSPGYYPTNAARDGKYRKIRVRTTRKGVALRTRPGYRK